jgi:hypothetical protein
MHIVHIVSDCLFLHNHQGKKDDWEADGSGLLSGAMLCRYLFIVCLSLATFGVGKNLVICVS